MLHYFNNDLHIHVESPPTQLFKNTQPFHDSVAGKRQGCSEHIYWNLLKKSLERKNWENIFSSKLLCKGHSSSPRLVNQTNVGRCDIIIAVLVRHCYCFSRCNDLLNLLHNPDTLTPAASKSSNAPVAASRRFAGLWCRMSTMASTLLRCWKRCCSRAAT